MGGHNLSRCFYSLTVSIGIKYLQDDRLNILITFKHNEYEIKQEKHKSCEKSFLETVKLKLAKLEIYYLWSRALPEKLPIVQPIRNFPAF
jgi:hypothetical protein